MKDPGRGQSSQSSPAVAAVAAASFLHFSSSKQHAPLLHDMWGPIPTAYFLAAWDQEDTASCRLVASLAQRKLCVANCADWY